MLSKSSMQAILVILAASSAVFAQSAGTSPAQFHNHASGLDARQIVALSVAATERSWQARDQYTYVERDEDRRLGARGQVKSENIDLSRIILVDGTSFKQLAKHNGQAPSAAEQTRSDEGLDKLRHETLAERSVRLRKQQEDISFLGEVLEAFDFQLIGEETVEGRPAYVLQARPHPG
jgi:hypothetical protein